MILSVPPATDLALDIVVVEDHDLVREELVIFLQRPGWSVRGVDCGDALDDALRQHPADLIVIDLNLPGEDGLSISRRLRAAMPDLGILMLTARVLSSDKTAGYQSGADVYLTKPASVAELEAVILSLSRRLRRVVADGPRLDVTACRLLLPDRRAADLTLLECRLLYELALAVERQLDTSMLLHRLGSHQGATSRNLPVIVSRLRHKIREQLQLPDIIKAVRGHGYRLTLQLALYESPGREAQ